MLSKKSQSLNIIRGLHNLKRSYFINGCVATIGTYDGVHLGHKHLLTSLKKKAKKLKLPSLVIIFEPHPQELFKKQQLPRLTSLREKILEFNKIGIDNVLILAFNKKFSVINAKKFIKTILYKVLHVKHLIIGNDFHFGHNKTGNFKLLKSFNRFFEIQISKIKQFKISGLRVSSSLIRKLLEKNKISKAAKFLGRQYYVIGNVIHGSQLGRNLGFPTANIYLSRRELLLNGVYAVVINGIKNKTLYGIANIGMRPTIMKNCSKKILEVYIFDFNENIYGKKLKVSFYKRIRSEKKFVSFDALKLQINKDIKIAKNVLKIL